MDRYIFYLIGLMFIGAGGCTSLSEGQENLPPDVELRKRVTLRPTPVGTLGRQMGGVASEINRKRNIEEFDRNGPAMTPNALRPRQLPFAPIDSTRHNIYWPVRPVIRPIRVNQ
ncbi:hypothetical protein DXT99_19740 [Pontibacter diazotrophicus]|uniref:Uncharacterized protein n=1 Tax=Pontibacter diazotrophicus TaxID=1400979 RepID=A0A3D8L7S0_9BACT|nr:hypothetical protein [Pontibacter diazotrophicus]RDV13424.1 hypothetical protein DXT99_19740 [Pontibacter diazotrophicus]